MDPSDFMAASRAVTRVEETHVRRLREVVFPLKQLGQEGDYTPDPDVMATIRQLPSSLQPVVTLMANMVPPSEEDKLWEKRRKDALAQSTSVILAVSPSFLRKFLEVLYLSSFTISFSFYRALWQPPGPTKTARIPSHCRLSGLPIISSYESLWRRRRGK